VLTLVNGNYEVVREVSLPDGCFIKPLTDLTEYIAQLINKYGNNAEIIKKYWNRYEVDCDLSNYDKKVYIGITDLWSQTCAVLYVDRGDLTDLIDKLKDSTSDTRLEYTNGLTYVLYIPHNCIKPLAAKLLEYVDTTPIDEHELSKLFNNNK